MKLNDCKFSVTTVLRTALLADTELAALLGEQIFPVFAPADTAGDFAVYYRHSYTLDDTKTAIARQVAQVIYVVVSDDYERSQTIATHIQRILHTYTPLHVRLIDSSEDQAERKYLQLLLFEVY